MYLVTGGAGFIGSVLVKMLNESDVNDIIIVDRLHSGPKWMNLRSLLYNSFIHADELFNDEYKGVFDGLKGIIHMGACSATTEKNVDYLMKNNVEFSQKLFNIAVKKDIPFIYASSAATYGDGELGYSDDHTKIDELRPLNPYGYSKQLFDQWVLKQKKYPSNWFGLKFFNVYGPNEYHKAGMRSVVIQAFEQIKATGKMKLFKSYKDKFNDGEQLRDFVYVKDVCQVMLKMLNSQSIENGIYNLGTGQARTFNDLVNSVYKALNVQSQIEYIEMPDSVRNQYQYFTQADMYKLMKAIPDFEFSSLEQGVEDYVLNYLSKSDPHF
jgi:ADP-L-glycero-D-manno-heptose 6-epimerase